MTKFFLAFAFVMVLPFSAMAQNRVALLVGNTVYNNPELTLRNPTNDVEDLTVALEALGFDVVTAIDQDRAGFMTALDQFELAAQQAEMAVFFFAGHGVQVDGENYFIGRDFDQLDNSSLQNSAMSMGEVTEVFNRAKPDIGIMILDACRNNPFVESGQVVKGLARSRGGAGLLIAYATDPGNVAYDGAGENSIFTKAIINHIATEGLDARIMFGRVRQQVILESRGQQIPWVEEAVLGEHYFAGQAGIVVASSEYARELQAWRQISAQSEIQPFQDYLDDFPQGVFSQFAIDRIRMISQARAAGAPSGQSSVEILKPESAERVEAALGVLGFLPVTRDLSDANLAALAAAFDLYRTQLPNPDEATADRLFEDAARITIFLAATTAQQLRTDIISLSSIDRTLKVANDAYRQIEQIAQTNDAAIPLLETARNDITAIEANLAQVMDRLDESRLYYQQLIDRAQDHFPNRIDTSLMDSTGQQAGLSRLEQRLANDAALFISHVQNSTPQTRGTYAWLIDFLPDN
ncbi:MAG: caspase family protein [Rhodobacteraceae bacterium]|nr:caspase family protein [Paracoccaceae bacterium]